MQVSGSLQTADTGSALIDCGRFVNGPTGSASVSDSVFPAAAGAHRVREQVPSTAR